MEKIFVKDVVGRGEEKHLLSHAILECCNKEVIALNKGDQGKTLDDSTRYIEVELKMNGITVKFVDFLNELEKQLDRMIDEAARDIVLKRLDDVTDTLYEIEKEATDVIKRVVKERLGVTIPEEW